MTDLQIRVLGPVDAVVDGGVVMLGSHHARKLLAALVVAANHVVSLDQLASVLWSENAPPSRDNTLQSYIHRLRQMLGPGVIVRENHGYELKVEVDQLDALLFESLVAKASSNRGCPEECALLCKQALGLWRGEAFGEFAEEEPFRLEAIRLSELRLFAMELKLESDLVSGRPEMVLGSVEALVEEHPYNERLWHILVEALARSGRRVDALRALQELRQVLGEVGLEPSHSMLDLEETVVRDQL